LFEKRKKELECKRYRENSVQPRRFKRLIAMTAIMRAANNAKGKAAPPYSGISVLVVVTVVPTSVCEVDIVLAETVPAKLRSSSSTPPLETLSN